MYPNLKAEFARRNWTLAQVVEKMKAKNEDMSMTIGTLSGKMRGLYPFTYNEAVFIKNEILETDLPLEVLMEAVE